MSRDAIDPEGITWLRVSPKYIPVQLVEWAVTAVLSVAVASLPLLVKLFGIWPAFPPGLAWTLMVATLVINLWMGLLVPRQVRSIGYAERDDDLLIRRGILFQRVMVVPYGRMQYVDVSVGPLERLFGLASVELHTASPHTDASIPGLPADEAARLREQLSARGQARLAGL